MNDQDQIIKDLKAELYDMSKQVQYMNSIIAGIVHELGLNEEKNLGMEDIQERIAYLVSLEEPKKKKK